MNGAGFLPSMLRMATYPGCCSTVNAAASSKAPHAAVAPNSPDTAIWEPGAGGG